MGRDIIIKSIEENSIAEELEIEPGDILLTVNGKKPQDILEYIYLVADDFIIIEIEKSSGEIWQLEIEKDYSEKIGIVFEKEMFDNPKHCHNKCIFCFIDQLPPGMRDSLYFKDDDARLSFLHGNYVTLTNISEVELVRIIKYKYQPMNISVHTTNPELRSAMLNNPKAANINAILNRLYKNNISMNLQIVLVPGINDGIELDNTLKDLIGFYPVVRSISVVPVGITKYREKLTKIRTFSDSEYKSVVEQISKIQKIALKKYGKRLVYASDEFFIKGKLQIPDIDYYDGFPQLENGVGMALLFYRESIDSLKNKYINVKGKKITVITGMLAYDMMCNIVKKVMDLYPQIEISLIPIENRFFGSEITVSGLVTGSDIIDQLSTVEIDSKVLFPSNMLRYKSDVFLDDITVGQVSRELNSEFERVELDGKKLIQKLLY